VVGRRRRLFPSCRRMVPVPDRKKSEKSAYRDFTVLGHRPIQKNFDFFQGFFLACEATELLPGRWKKWRWRRMRLQRPWLQA